MGFLHNSETAIHLKTSPQTVQERRKRQHPLPRAINGKRGNCQFLKMYNEQFHKSYVEYILAITI